VRIVRLLALLPLLACGSPPPAEAPVPDEPADAGSNVEILPAPTTSAAPLSQPSGPVSTASFEEATASPEPVDIHDEHLQLTDAQLTGPMRGALDRCAVPKNAHVTIKTAVQNGRAIGVTVEVVFDKPKPKKRAPPPSRAALKAEAKTKERIVTCADKAVRTVTWPPSKRRDSFTTVF
jgi:hypothetical protein